MQINKKRLQEDGDTKELFSIGAAYKKKIACQFFPNQDTRVMGGHVLVI